MDEEVWLHLVLSDYVNASYIEIADTFFCEFP